MRYTLQVLRKKWLQIGLTSPANNRAEDNVPQPAATTPVALRGSRRLPNDSHATGPVTVDGSPVSDSLRRGKPAGSPDVSDFGEAVISVRTGHRHGDRSGNLLNGTAFKGNGNGDGSQTAGAGSRPPYRPTVASGGAAPQPAGGSVTLVVFDDGSPQVEVNLRFAPTTLTGACELVWYFSLGIADIVRMS